MSIVSLKNLEEERKKESEQMFDGGSRDATKSTANKASTRFVFDPNGVNKVPGSINIKDLKKLHKIEPNGRGFLRTFVVKNSNFCCFFF